MGFSVSTLASALVGACSLLYFGVASHWLGDEALSLFVIAMAEVGIIQALLIPRAWLYVISAPKDALGERVSASMAIEVIGGALGLLILVAYCAVRGFDSDGFQLRLIVYFSFWIPSLTSVNGAYRAAQRWFAYFMWIAGSTILRVPMLALVVPHLDRTVSPARSIMQAALASYLVPELIRVCVGLPPLLRRYFRWPSIGSLRAAFLPVSANWRFDVGSSLTDSLDKLFVGALFGPHILTVYFFARRIAGAVTMVQESFYAHVYQRRIESLRSPSESCFLWFSYAAGLGISLSIALFVGVIFFIVSTSPVGAHYLPESAVSNPVLFICVIGLDAVFCANRWYRYISLHWGASLLFAIRIASFLVFLLVAWWDVDIMSPSTPLTAMACALFIDTLALVYFVRATQKSHRPLSPLAQ